MKMIMNRDLVVQSMIGHCIRFEKDVPINVPEALVPLVMEKGGLPADGEELDNSA
mgnify:CR=1 FL=1